MLADWRTAPIEASLRAMLGYLERLTLAPAELGPADLALLHAAGLSDAAIAEAVAVAALFNIIDRVADALDFFVPSPEAWAARAPIMLAMGYARFADPSIADPSPEHW